MLKNLFILNRKKKNVNFFDYPASVQKKLVAHAVEGANEMQLALVKEYDKKYLNIKKRKHLR